MINDQRLVNQLFDNRPSVHHIFEKKLVYQLAKNKKVLDIGCWTGQFLSLIELGSKTYGVEPNKEAVKYAKKNRKGKYYVGSALALPFRSGFFDLVTLWDVIEHLPANTEEQAIAEANRVLKKGGLLALCTVTTHPLSVFLDPAFFLMGHRHYSRKALTRYLNHHNFSIEKVVYSGGIWTLIHDNLSLILKHVFKKSNNISWIEKLVKQEHQGRGFVEIHLICKKLSA